MIRNALLTTSTVGLRSLHSSPVAAKTATEKVKEVADKVCYHIFFSGVEFTDSVQVNKSVGRGLAHAIEKGEEATEATKEAVGKFGPLTTSSKPQASGVVPRYGG